MREYNGENLEELLKEGVHLVDFYATWCGPCKMLSTVLEEVEDEIDIIRINTDKYSELASKYRIMSIPHLIFFKDGKEVNYSVGFIDKETLMNYINEVKNI